MLLDVSAQLEGHMSKLTAFCAVFISDSAADISKCCYSRFCRKFGNMCPSKWVDASNSLNEAI